MSNDLPRMVYADEDGNIFDHPDLLMAGQSADCLVLPDPEDIIPLPEGSRLFTLPGRLPAGWDPSTEKFEIEPSQNPVCGGRISPVAAFLPPAYTRTLLPACKIDEDSPLPLWAYTAVGWKDDGFCVTAVRVDQCTRWDPRHFDDRGLRTRIRGMKKSHPGNRLIRHLAKCAAEYHCFAAKNLFFGRWECPLPTSPWCNAQCAGCLSFQPAESCTASHERIDFVPTPEEIAQVAGSHLEKADFPIASFGQGCEGEPLLVADTIADAVRAIRTRTSRGIINLNSNGSLPEKVELLVKAGLDSIRISLNSLALPAYNAYYRPLDYSFDDVISSVMIASRHGLFTMLNLLVFPGFTDRIEEVQQLEKLIKTAGIHMIQMRNLNIDPAQYLRCVPVSDGKTLGIRALIARLKKRFPNLIIGYFNKPAEEIPFPIGKGEARKQRSKEAKN